MKRRERVILPGVIQEIFIKIMMEEQDSKELNVGAGPSREKEQHECEGPLQGMMGQYENRVIRGNLSLPTILP